MILKTLSIENINKCLQSIGRRKAEGIFDFWIVQNLY